MYERGILRHREKVGEEKKSIGKEENNKKECP